jgi:hypothetical protein
MLEKEYEGERNGVEDIGKGIIGGREKGGWVVRGGLEERMSR